MADEGGGITGLFREHPMIMLVAVLAVALLAWMASRSSGGAGSAVIVNPANDPNAGNNAAAIAEANIAAGAENVNTAASLIGAQNTNAANLRAALGNTEASRQVGLASIAAQLEAARITAAAQAAAITSTNNAVNTTPVVNNNGGTGVSNPPIPTALQWFGAHPPATGTTATGAGAYASGQTAAPASEPIPADAQAWIDEQNAKVQAATQQGESTFGKIVGAIGGKLLSWL